MKKLISTLLCLILILSLSGCGFGFIHEEYTRPNETMPPETYSSEEIPGLEPGTYYYLMEETFEDFETGITTRTEYIPGDSAPRIGLIIYKNDVEVRRENWEVDAQNNIIKNTVTVDGEVTEIWNYELTYNALFKLDKKVCTLNGQWQITYDYVYGTRKPFNLIRILVEQPGEELPPWYMFGYKNNRMVSIGKYYADTQEDYGKNGRGEFTIDLVFLEDGNLENRRVTEKNSGFYGVYYEKFAYDGNHVTVSRFTGPDDLILRAEETYDDAGNLLLREEYSPEGDLLRRITHVYEKKTIN